tara:strand:- start:757 stop:1122 length:366 start_codon:yes stop_codon:yes gene_type:complete
MAKEEVKAKAKGEDGKVISLSCTYDFGGDLNGYIKKASANGADGTAVAYSKVKASEKIDVQDIMRRLAVAGKSSTEIQKTLDAHVPGVKKRGKSKSEKMKDDFDALSPEERAKLIADLTGG